ncbi:class I SAM-dependent methyltransferase [Kribbella amoyensis]|uniref:class I SAM-dependent methyltransferase n=1 Tax=Kribbella amoyensis TaxID=996641 RepID=UPI00192D6D14|nr:class I SAM-dependent methyltransferase [Kribbella amoyensis]
MERWSSGDKYEPYVGRWSRVVGREFLGWLAQPAGLRWLDVGCGTGALSQTILATANPAEVVGLDRSPEYAEYARRSTADARARFVVGDAETLLDERFDVIVSGLVLNFVPDKARALRRMREAGGTVAAYVWDYAGGMQLMKYFWDVAGELDPEHRDLDEGTRFPFTKPDPLETMFGEAGFAEVESREIVVPTVFRDFDDYWAPFLGGQGAAPAYVSTMTDDLRDEVRNALRARLPVESDGSIRLTARAWAVRGIS